MSDDYISEYQANSNLDFEFSSDKYMSLHDGNPGEGGANEIAGVARVLVPPAGWSEAAAKALHNVEDINFADMPECVATHGGQWDALEGGNYSRGWELDEPLEVEVPGSTATIPAETAVFTIENKPEA